MRMAIRFAVLTALKILRFLYPEPPTGLASHLRAAGWLAVFAGGTVVVLTILMIDFSKVRGLHNYRPPLPSELLDRKGRLITTYFRDNRALVRKEDVPVHLRQAFIAMEDNHFEEHFGIDVQAIIRAMLINIASGSVQQGGSTITQQLAKVILTDGGRNILRKAQEALLALYLELTFTKQEILLLYFNQIYFGHGNYGVEAASQFYFQKSVRDISIAEAAVLASLPSAPNRFSPIKSPRLSQNRTRLVLMKMIDMGFLSPEKAREADDALLIFYNNINQSPTETAFGNRIDNARYFSETIRVKLEKEIGKELLYTGGLKIHTGLDLDHQAAAEKALWRGLREQNIRSADSVFTRHEDLSGAYNNVLDLIGMNFDLPDFKVRRTQDQRRLELHFQKELADSMEMLNLGLGGESTTDKLLAAAREADPFGNRYRRVQGALVEVDNETGEVTAMVGGLPFSSQNQINRAWQIRRQPGSTFKALLYTAAIETRKVTAATLFNDSPVVFLDTEGESWMPQNYSSEYRGFITMRDALAYSANSVSIGVAREAGLGNVLPNIAKQLNVPSNAIPHNYSVALGSYEVSPLQLATAMAIIPRNGRTLPYVLLHKITDANGRTIREYTPAESKTILQPGTSTIMNAMLKSVVDYGTGTGVRSYGYGGYAAGKTGTTDNYRDAWFVGYNKRYTATVWVGYDRSTLSLGAGQSGGNIAAPIWGDFNARLAATIRDEKEILPSGGANLVTICVATGALPGSGCPKTREEFFLPGTEPQNSEDVMSDDTPRIKNNAGKSDFFRDDAF